jgi:hypothetical protein
VAHQFAQTARAVWETTAMGHIKATFPDGKTNEGWRVATFNGAEKL